MSSETANVKSPHPLVWMVLYIPFGALGGFVSIGLTFLASQNGMSISEGSLLNAAQLLTSWLKWIWAPVVDLTLTPRRWTLIGTGFSALGVLAMSIVPLDPDHLWLLLIIIALASLVNSVVGMAVEAMIGRTTKPEEAGRVSAWFQAGNLGGTGLGGGLGLFLLQRLPSPWMAGAIMGLLFMLCCTALLFTPVLEPHRGANVIASVKNVLVDLREMVKLRGGLLAAILCAMPVGTGAAQGLLTQEKVAAFWGAGANEVALLQGVLAGFITAVGCFVGGYVCQRIHPRLAYALIGVALGVVATAMAISPANITMFVVWSLAYSFFVGLAYAAFTAVVLNSMGTGSAATKYNMFASLSNFPLWWMGLLLGLVAKELGPRAMLLTEAGMAVLGVALFGLASYVFRNRPNTPREAA